MNNAYVSLVLALAVDERNTAWAHFIFPMASLNEDKARWTMEFPLDPRISDGSRLRNWSAELVQVDKANVGTHNFLETEVVRTIDEPFTVLLPNNQIVKTIN